MLLNSKFKPRGLFGGFDPTVADQTPMADPAQELRRNLALNNARQAMQPKTGGFFGEGGIGRSIAGTIGDYLLQVNGMQPIYQPAIQQRQMMQYRSQQAEQDRMNAMQDWQAKEQWRLDHPAPVNNDTVNDFNWYKGLSPQERQIYDQMKPVVVQGPDGPYVVPRSAISGNAPIGSAGLQSDWDSASPMGGSGGNVTGGFPVAKATGFNSYSSGSYGPLEATAGKEFGVPPEMLFRVRTKGERSNANQVSEVGARSVYQVTPETRQLIIQKYKFDPWSSPANAARGAAIVLRDMYRKFGNWNDAMTGYHGGNDTRNWGKRTRAYAQRTNYK